MWRQAGFGSSKATWAVAWVLLVTATLIGCESSEPGPAANGSAGEPAKSKGSRPAADMVAAVSTSKTPGPVEVHFALSGKPTVGQPVEIRFSIAPVTELDRLFARFQASEGLEVVKGAETQHYDRPTVGTPLTHSVTLIPKADGIFNVTATVAADSPKDSETRIYSIPVIAGEGLPELPAAPAAAAPAKPARP